jgi:hypothetical protein
LEIDLADPEGISHQGRLEGIQREKVVFGKKGDGVVPSVGKGVGKQPRLAATKPAFGMNVGGEKRGVRLSLWGRQKGQVSGGDFSR